MKMIYFFGLMGILLLSDSIFIRTANAEIKSIAVSVDGLTCPFCAYGIEKKIMRLKGVKEIKILLNAGTVTLKCAENKNPAFADIRSAVKDAGFTPRLMKITAHGTIIVDEIKGLLFKFNESELPIPLMDLERNLKEKCRYSIQLPPKSARTYTGSIQLQNRSQKTYNSHKGTQ